MIGHYMATYKISGKTTEEAIIYVIQDEEYKGKKRILPGPYEIIFESASTSNVLAVAESIDGRIMNFGNVVPIKASEEISNLTCGISTRGITKIAVLDDLDMVINKLGNYTLVKEDDIILLIGVLEELKLIRNKISYL